MNQLPPPPPLALKGNIAENFKQFKQAFEIYMIASGIGEKGDKVQANVLLHIIGAEAISVYNGFTFEAAADKDDPAKIMKKFEDYCIPRSNTTFERHKFNKRVQSQTETFDQFYTDLCYLGKTCTFGDLADQMVRDRIVVGISHSGLKEKLLRVGNELTLTKTIDICRAWEATSAQSGAIQGHESVQAQVHSLSHSGQPRGRGRSRGRGNHGNYRGRGRGSFTPHSPHQQSPGQQGQTHTSKSPGNSSCQWCGFTDKHDRSSCPARNATCNYCHVKGHFKAACRKKDHSRSVHNIQDPTQAEASHPPETGQWSEDFLGAITQAIGGVKLQSETSNDVMVKVNGHSLPFRVDTGADVNVISQESYDKAFASKLLSASPVLRGPDLKDIKTSGYFKAIISYGSKTTSTLVYVLPKSASLLSRKVCQELGLVTLNIHAITSDVPGRYPKLFHGLGKLQTEYKIQLDSEATPYAVHAPRRVPLPLLGKVKEELNRLQTQGVIVPITEPTPWCAPIVVVPKSNSQSVRICVDLTKLNAAVRRERHILPSVEHLLGQMSGARVFSKIDANSGFHQIPLSQSSQLLTTFITPFGRYAYQRLPFGISSGPELFQREMSRILEGLEGVVCLMDDVVIFGRSQDEHDKRLRTALDALVLSGITLNRAKCVFNKSQIEFIGQVVSEHGVTASEDKLSAIKQMKTPEDIHELRRFLGMVQQLGKFAPNLSEITEPLRCLLSVKNPWYWGPDQTRSFNETKALLVKSPVLALYDVSLPTKITADSSSYGLGAVLTQQHPEGWRPVAYASRTLTTTEQRYAQIEKEALAATWACEKFEDYILGLKFTLESDHKPLIPLLGQKDIEQLPPRLQRLRLRLMRYTFEIVHIPGKDLKTADTLSRAPIVSSSTTNLEQDINLYVQSVVENLPASDVRLEQIRLHQQEDITCRTLMAYCQEGWPDRSQLNGTINQYWPYRAEFTQVEGLLMYGTRIVVPTSLRLDILDRLHEGHQGITKCRLRAQQSVWWPGLSRQVTELVENCRICCQNAKNHMEPLIPSRMPDGPWLKVATDLFEFQKKTYLLVVDYYSRFIEIAKLSDTTSGTVVNHMKSLFSRFGIPQCVVSDNGPQYSSQEFANFSQSYGFRHITSSPGHASANGEAERAVQTVKQLLRACDDPYAALLSYRVTPLQNGYSPAELLMSRRLRTKVPEIPRKPTVPDAARILQREENYRQKMSVNFDRHHAARNLPSLTGGQEVWIPDRKQFGTVQDRHSNRSYIVETPTGTYRRNRVQLNGMPIAIDQQPEETPPAEVPTTEVPPPPTPERPQVNRPPSVHGDPPVTTRSGRVVNRPQRYEE